MADDRKIDIDDLLVRPGTYFNPQTEVMVVVDDSPDLDPEIFNMEAFEGADWVKISDDLPLDEEQRDAMLESFQSTAHADVTAGVTDGDDEPEEEPELEEDPNAV